MHSMKKTIKIVQWGVTVFVILCIILMLICNQIVVNNAKGKVFSEIDSIKYNKVGLLLGTTPQARIGRITNYFFVYRIDATERLYKARKIEKILISGDEHSLDGVNEPECMRDSLVARGVPASAIILDGKGYRTICSVINANKVFGLNSFTVISQKFHNERAIYQAEHLGLDVENIQAYNAEDPKSRRAYLTTIREYFARVKMSWDILINKDSFIESDQMQSEQPFKVIADLRAASLNLSGNDSFNVFYRKPINGYTVKAVVKQGAYPFNSADITFIKNKKQFTLHSLSFGDTLYNKVFPVTYKNNDKVMQQYRNKSFYSEYCENRMDDEVMLGLTPFFFKDLDFDGVDELIIVHLAMEVRNHSGFDVYRIVDGEPVLIDYPPYKNGDDFGMTDYPEFDFTNKTISCPYPEGPGGLGYEGRTIYGISKKQKDTVIVNRRKHYFNHMEIIKEIKYEKE